MAEVFLDTAYAIALASKADQHHAMAVELAEELKAAGTMLVTTQAVVLEIGNALSMKRRRHAAVQLFDVLSSDPQVEVVSLSEQLMRQSLQLFRDRPDKDWGLTDCLSFIVMEQRGIALALTTDVHFQQAGFEAMMRTRMP
ncbi:MAG: type II toxin-antitoxin system VapC family toxin [Planctomycetaceae bacterium]